MNVPFALSRASPFMTISVGATASALLRVAFGMPDLRDVRENRVVDDANRRIRVHLDRVKALVSDRFSERDRPADVPVRARFDVHAARRALHQALDRVVKLLLVSEAAGAAEVEVRVAAGLFDALVEDAPHIAQTLRLRH